MRPLKHGPVSFVSHMFVRNNTYYYRANVPTDLQHYFPTTEIKKSLKTKESKTAKFVAISFEYNVQQTFAMLRTGMLPEDMIQQLVERIVPVKHKQPVTKGRALADVLPGYIKAKKAEWTDKTKMEVDGVVKLLVDIIGDAEITTITRPMVLELRSTLQKLSPNMYKRYSGQTIQQVFSCKG